MSGTPVLDASAQDLYGELDARSGELHTLLDIGCGRGAHLAHGPGSATFADVLERGGTVIGIDVAPPAEGNPYVSELRTIGPDGRWPVEPASVDLAFCDWVLEHVADPPTFFGECARTLRPGGAFVARTMQRWSVAGIGARVVPSRLHNRLIRRLQPGMNSQDIFPTTLRCNSKRALLRLCTDHGLEIAAVRTHRTLDGYGLGRARVQRFLQLFERCLPSGMRHAIVVVLVRPV